MEVTFRRTGERLAREHLGELARSERLAAEALRAWVRGPRPHADERLERVCSRLDELSAGWQALAIGGELSLTWTGTPRVPHPASGERRGPTRRAERGVRRSTSG